MNKNFDAFFVILIGMHISCTPAAETDTLPSLRKGIDKEGTASVQPSNYCQLQKPKQPPKFPPLWQRRQVSKPTGSKLNPLPQRQAPLGQQEPLESQEIDDKDNNHLKKFNWSPRAITIGMHTTSTFNAEKKSQIPLLVKRSPQTQKKSPTTSPIPNQLLVGSLLPRLPQPDTTLTSWPQQPLNPNGKRHNLANDEKEFKFNRLPTLGLPGVPVRNYREEVPLQLPTRFFPNAKQQEDTQTLEPLPTQTRKHFPRGCGLDPRYANRLR